VTQTSSKARAGTPGRTTTGIAAPTAETAEGSSLFVNGFFPKRRWLVVVIGLVIGFLATYLWSAQLADDTIGLNVADGILGRDAHGTPIGSIASGIVFAFVSGLAGSFTACNIAAFGAMGPLVGRVQSSRDRFVQTVKPLGWLAVGMIPVSAIYGAIVGIVGTSMPQFSTVAAKGITPRAIQSMIAFGVIGVIMLVLGLASTGVIGDPMARISRRFRAAPMVLMGALIGGFLIGRPYPLFRDMFRHAAETHNPAYGAFAFVLQSIGNIVVISILFILLSYIGGPRLQRWLSEKPQRSSAVTAGAFIVGAVFLVLYWDVRVLARLGYLWFPASPWT
jgi:hypothetical protein